MDRSNEERQNGGQPNSVGGILIATFAILGAPIIWALHFNVMYFLVQPVCRLGGEMSFHIASVIALVSIVAAAFTAWRVGRRVESSFREKLEGMGGWQGFVGAYGVISAALFAYAVIYSWSRVFFLDACLGIT